MFFFTKEIIQSEMVQDVFKQIILSWERRLYMYTKTNTQKYHLARSWSKGE